MSQSVKIAGALFQNVPSISVPDENDVYHGFFDVSDTTATASDVASGKFFHDALGVLTAGTASGGGGGLVYETGIYTPTTDTAVANISFSNSHTDCPFFAVISDTDGYSSTTNSNMCVSYVYWGDIGGAIYPSSSSMKYGEVRLHYRASNTSSLSASTVTLSYPSSNTGTSNSSYPRFWVTPSAFKPQTSSNSRYWRANRSYKWIAVWKP